MIKEVNRFVLPFIIMVVSMFLLGRYSQLEDPILYFTFLSLAKLGFLTIVAHLIRVLYLGHIDWSNNSDKVFFYSFMVLAMAVVVGS